MSLLIYQLAADQVVVLNDTLSATDDGVPYGFGPKTEVLPHSDVVLTMLGSHRLHRRWAHRVIDGTLHDSIDDLVPVMAELLASATTEDERDVESVAYAFGWSPAEERMVGFAFPSAGFAPERLPDGLSIHPPILDGDGSAIEDDAGRGGWRRFACTETGEPILDEDGAPVETREPPAHLSDLMSLAVARQELVDQDFAEGRTTVRIGGHLLMTVLERGVIVCRRLCELADYREHRAAADLANRLR